MPLASDAAYIDLLMARLGNRSEATLRVKVLTEFNIQKDELEHGSFLPWFLETSADLSLAQGQSEISLPTGFLREVEDRPPTVILVSDNSENRPRKRKSGVIEGLDLNVTEQGRPTRYTVKGTVIRVWPIADAAYIFRFPHIAVTPSVQDSSGVLNAWFANAPNYLLGLTGAVVAALHVQNPALIGSFGAMTTRARNELIASNEAREHTNMDYSDSDALIEELD